MGIYPIDSSDMQLDIYLFSPTAIVIGYDKSRDLFQRIAVTVCKKKKIEQIVEMVYTVQFKKNLLVSPGVYV